MKQLKFDDKKLLAIFQSFMNGIEEIECPTNKKAAKNLMDELGERFFTAPASGRLAYHNCMPGGLVEHSLRVYSIFKNLSSQYGEDFENDDIIIASLFHDFGKVGDLVKDYYVPKNSDWHVKNMGLVYEINPELNYMPHAQRSLELLSYYGFNLVSDVYRGILIHDGQYVDENKPYKMKEGRFALLLSMADRLACEIEKDRWDAIQ